MLDFTNPQIWWYLTRASAIVAWVLMTLTVVWGILLKTRILRGADNPEWLTVTHRYISGLALAMIATHMATLILDEWVSFTVADVLVPFSNEFKPWPVALGIFAFWLVILVQVTALGARWLPDWLWKGIHLSSYASIALVALHSGLVGTDVGKPWYTVLSLILIITLTLAALLRLIIAGRAKPVRQQTEAPTSALPTPSRSTRETFDARVVDRVNVGDSLALLTLEPTDPTVDLEWEEGAHLTLHLGNGVERQYSLAGDPAEQNRLVIGVLKTRGEGGGSAWIHETLDVGSVIVCDKPRNSFPLKPAHRYQFIASGVGITAIHAMLYCLPASREWSLLYLGRTRSDMLFVDELVQQFGDRVTLWVSEERGSRAPLDALVDPLAEVYACGSASVLATLENYVAPKRLHVERFEPIERKPSTKFATFDVVAARSGVTVSVGENESVLDTLENAGIEVHASCRRGTCGSCELSVVSGSPDHLDSVMPDHDKDDLGIMFPCVSRSREAVLTLDV